MESSTLNQRLIDHGGPMAQLAIDGGGDVTRLHQHQTDPDNPCSKISVFCVAHEPGTFVIDCRGLEWFLDSFCNVIDQLIPQPRRPSCPNASSQLAEHLLTYETATMSVNSTQIVEIRPYIPPHLEKVAAEGGWEWCIDPWMFDDPERNISQEAFILGGDLIVSYAARHLLPRARRGFRLLFSASPFDGAEHACLKEPTPEFGGAIYTVDTPDAVKLHGEVLEGWLCPTTLACFEDFPERVYFKALPLDGESGETHPIYAQK